MSERSEYKKEAIKNIKEVLILRNAKKSFLSASLFEEEYSIDQDSEDSKDSEESEDISDEEKERSDISGFLGELMTKELNYFIQNSSHNSWKEVNKDAILFFKTLKEEVFKGIGESKDSLVEDLKDFFDEVQNGFANVMKGDFRKNPQKFNNRFNNDDVLSNGIDPEESTPLSRRNTIASHRDR